MICNRQAKRTYKVSWLGPLVLKHDVKRELWTMQGGKYGSHSIYGPNCFNERVAAHWQGYIENNGLDASQAQYKIYDNLPANFKKE